MSIMIRSLQVLKTKVKYYLVVMTSIETHSIKIKEMTKSVVFDRTVNVYGLVLCIHITGFAEEDSCD
jgi:hypothetical protein